MSVVSKIINLLDAFGFYAESDLLFEIIAEYENGTDDDIILRMIDEI